MKTYQTRRAVQEVQHNLSCPSTGCFGDMVYSGSYKLVAGRIHYAHVCTKCKIKGFFTGARYPYKTYCEIKPNETIALSPSLWAREGSGIRTKYIPGAALKPKIFNKL